MIATVPKRHTEQSRMELSQKGNSNTTDQPLKTGFGCQGY